MIVIQGLPVPGRDSWLEVRFFEIPPTLDEFLGPWLGGAEPSRFQPREAIGQEMLVGGGDEAVPKMSGLLRGVPARTGRAQKSRDECSEQLPRRTTGLFTPKVIVEAVDEGVPGLPDLLGIS
tara:strand:+ start:185 stop:550 length:366 start_codon:yes stop_codon:yes gene_type:complete